MTAPAAGAKGRKRLPQIAWSAAALALLLLFNAFFSPGFFDVELRDGRLHGSLIDVLDRAAPLILVSLGMALVVATAGIDLSVGAVMAVAGAVAACLVARPDFSPLSAVDLGGSFTLAAGLKYSSLARTVALTPCIFGNLFRRTIGVSPMASTMESNTRPRPGRCSAAFGVGASIAGTPMAGLSGRFRLFPS